MPIWHAAPQYRFPKPDERATLATHARHHDTGDPPTVRTRRPAARSGPTACPSTTTTSTTSDDVTERRQPAGSAAETEAIEALRDALDVDRRARPSARATRAVVGSQPEGARWPTRPNRQQVDPSEFIASVEHPVRRADAEVLLAMMTRVTGSAAEDVGPVDRRIRPVPLPLRQWPRGRLHAHRLLTAHGEPGGVRAARLRRHRRRARAARQAPDRQELPLHQQVRRRRSRRARTHRRRRRQQVASAATRPYDD